MEPMSAIALATTGSGVLGSLINTLYGPKSYLEEDVRHFLQLDQSRALAENAASTRRRLASAGLGGSGAVNAIISDQASRIRDQFESQRQRLLMQVKEMQHQQAQQAQQSRGELFSGLAGLGMSLYNLNQPSPFQPYLDQLRQLQLAQTSLPSGSFSNNPVVMPDRYFNNPYQSLPEMNPFQQLPASNFNFQFDPIGYTNPRIS